MATTIVISHHKMILDLNSVQKALCFRLKLRFSFVFPTGDTRLTRLEILPEFCILK